jgi:flavin reductase (DIM6/NTAB) family NADH-FMN oxidoreductase RutF
MEKAKLGNMPVSPTPAVMAGALVDGKVNYITLGGYGLISLRPPMVYITSSKTHYTNIGIRQNGYFSVNIPSTGLIQKMDYCGLVSGSDTDKSTVFTPFYGSIDRAPMIKECPVNILCKVTNTIDLPNNDVFFGEVLEVYASKDCMTDGRPDPKKIDPVILMGGHYWELGDIKGAAYREGKALISKK